MGHNTTISYVHTIVSTMAAQQIPAGNTSTCAMHNISLSTGFVLSGLPVWTNTMTIGGGGAANTSIPALTPFTTVVSDPVITLTPTINITMNASATSPGAVSTTDSNTPGVNLTHTQPLPSLVGSGGLVTQLPTPRPEHKSPGATTFLDCTTALVAVALVHIFFRG